MGTYIILHISINTYMFMREAYVYFQILWTV